MGKINIDGFNPKGNNAKVICCLGSLSLPSLLRMDFSRLRKTTLKGC